MKLNSHLIKELRLARSWTQEQLAEKARLNPRTIQRVELEGQASLRTRVQIALALGVSPAELDLLDATPADASSSTGWRGALHAYTDQTNLHALTLQLLVALLFLASAPAYFSWSKVAFSWANLTLGKHWSEVGWWWVTNLSLWALVSLPLLIWAWQCRREWLAGIGATALATLALSIARLWEPELVAGLLTMAVFFMGLVLLACQCVPRWPVTQATHLLYGVLFAYVFLWFFQPLVYLLAFLFFHLQRDGLGYEPWFSISAQLARLPGKLAQLLPVICVLLLAREQRSGRSLPGMPALQAKAPQSEQGAEHFHERQLLEM